MLTSLKEYLFPLPRFSSKALYICLRQAIVTLKLWKGALAFIILEPLIVLVGMGYGIGSLVENIGGVRYIEYIAIGYIVFSPANVAVLETMYGGFSRMEHQRTWEGIIDTSMSIDDVIFGEIIWSTIRGLLSGLALWFAATILGALSDPFNTLGILFISAIMAFCASSVGMILVSRAKVFDIFTIFHTVVFMPSMFLSGVFFPISQLPQFLQIFAYLLPFAPLIESARQISQGSFFDWHLFYGIFLAIVYAIPAYYISMAGIRRRLLR